MIIVIGKCEELERVVHVLEKIEHGQRETNRLLKVIAAEEAPKQLASTGFTVAVVSP